MNLAETARLLAVIARVDNRRADDATAMVWQSILGDLPHADCLQAVRRHFATSTEYLMPAHIRAGVLAIRHERVQHHEIRELPSRFEDDDERVQRVRRGIAAYAEALNTNHERHQAAQPAANEDDPSETSRQRAIARARRERSTRRSSMNEDLIMQSIDVSAWERNHP